MTEPTPSPAAPGTSTTSDGAAPYGIGAVRLVPGLAPAELADRLFALPDEVAGLPQRQVTSSADSATAVYAIDEGVPTPRFGMVVVLKVTARADADAAVADLQRQRWGDPKDHHVTAAGTGSGDEPAYREFSRSFPPGLFLLPYRPVFFLLWYRADEEYAFMVIGDTPAVREELARAMAVTLTDAAR